MTILFFFPLVTVCLTGCWLFSPEVGAARCIIAEGAPLLSTRVGVVSQSRRMRSLLQVSATTCTSGRPHVFGQEPPLRAEQGIQVDHAGEPLLLLGRDGVPDVFRHLASPRRVLAVFVLCPYPPGLTARLNHPRPLLPVPCPNIPCPFSPLYPSSPLRSLYEDLFSVDGHW